MVKLTSLVLSGAMALSLAGCGDGPHISYSTDFNRDGLQDTMVYIDDEGKGGYYIFLRNSEGEHTRLNRREPASRGPSYWTSGEGKHYFFDGEKLVEAKDLPLENTSTDEK